MFDGIPDTDLTPLQRRIKARREKEAGLKTRNPELVRQRSRRDLLWKKYGLTVEQFEWMWEQQDGKCAICKDPLKRGVGGASVDHCHRRETVRKILCRPCNTSLGALRERPEVMEAMIAYLKEYS